MKIIINKDKLLGKILPLHGVNNAPYQIQLGSNQEFIDRFFNEAQIPYSRLHDTQGRFGGCHFVDIPNIFPDFDADETNEKNYDFILTDEFITAVIKTNCKIIYRLGVTIENSPTIKYRTFPPKDNAKWARICEHIIRHYNEGWANGFKYNIEDWEIWNEPDNPPMWTGTKEEYFKLYVVTAKYLKKCFPNIKVGGFSSCGFYAITGKSDDKRLVGFVNYFNDFLKYIKNENAPLDFCSWHMYTKIPEEIIESASYARKMLDENGFTETENAITEWNYGPEGGGFVEMRGVIGASYLTTVFTLAQRSKLLDTATYYDANLQTKYNGLWDIYTEVPNKAWYAFIAFGKLRKLGFEMETIYKNEIKGINAISATNGKGDSAVLISNYLTDKTKIDLDLSCFNGLKYECYTLNEEYNLEKTSEGNSDCIDVEIEKNTFLLYKINNK